MNALIIVLIIVLCLLLVLAYIPLKEYVDDDDNLVVKLLFTKHVFPLDEVELVQIQPDDLKGLVRMFGSSNGGIMCGKFYNSRLGNVRIYTRSLAKVVCFEFRGSKYIVNDWRSAYPLHSTGSECRADGTNASRSARSEGRVECGIGANATRSADSEGSANRRGAAQVEAIDMPFCKLGGTRLLIFIGVILAVVAFLCIGSLPSKTYVDAQNNVHFGEQWLKHYSLPVDSLEIIPLPEHAFDGGMKVNGSAIGTKRSGKFSSDSLGNYRIYADGKSKLVLFTYHGEKFIVNDWR